MPELRGNLKMRVLVDQKTILSTQAAINRQSAASAKAMVEAMAEFAVRNLANIDKADGRKMLSRLWRYLPITALATGGAQTEVYSLAEKMTFYAKSGVSDRKRDNRYPISGERLLGLLIGGVKKHRISARSPNKMLAFPAVAGRKQSDTGGLAITGQGLEGARHRTSRAYDTAIVAKAVSHPGYVGSNSINATRQLLLLRTAKLLREIRTPSV